MDGKNLTPQEEKLKQLKEILPEAFAEGKVDWEKLKATLGEDINFANERYVLNWAGKSDAFKVLQTPTTKTLVPDKKESVNFDETKNIFIEGENLEVLKVLQKSYFGKVKMIYIDPPYNTGNDSFIYPDKFSETKAEYQKRIGDKDEDGYLTKDNIFSSFGGVPEGGCGFRKNSKENGQYHSNWLNMMMPRLYLAKNLLKQDGVIFISIDDNELNNLKNLCDEIFGEENFRSQIIRATGTTTGQEAMKIGSSYDSCLCYSKSYLFELKGIPLKGKDLNRFNNDDNDGKGKYALLQLRKTGNADRKEDREGMFFPITAPDESLVYPIGPSDYLSRWRVGKGKFKIFLDDNLIVWKENSDYEELDDEDEENEDDIDEKVNDYLSITNDNVDIEKFKSKWKPYVKYYLSDRTKQVSNLWIDIDGNKKGSIELKLLFDKKKLFDNPKPTDFIKRLITISTGKNDTILDFFAGSGSTAHSILNFNKEQKTKHNFICVQLPEPCQEKSISYKAGYKTIADIAKERIRRAGKKIQEEINKKIKSKEKEIKEFESQLDIDRKEEKINNLKAEIEKLKQQDIGFKVLKLSNSNFKQWQQIKGNDAQALAKQMEMFVDPVSENATTENMVYELLLKSGKDLNSKLEHKFPSFGGVSVGRGGKTSFVKVDDKARNSKNYFNLPYNPKLKERARELRKAGNLSEVLFWNEIKNKQFKGFDFDRQKIIGNYIVDFFCTNCNVVIEIDGVSHDDKQEYDAKRDAYLESLGLTAIHIDDLDVKKKLNEVMNYLYNHPALSGTIPKEGNKQPAEDGSYYCVNNNELIFMLEKASQEIVESVLKEKPQKVVALDRLFKGNDQLKTNTALQMRDAGIEFKTI